MNQSSSTKFDYQVLLILISLMYIIHYHMVILVSQQCWSLAAKCGYRNWLLNLQVTVSHINHGWIRPIYWNTSCATTWILSWILALTLSNFLVLDLNLDNVLRNFFVSIAICGHSDHKTNSTVKFTLNNGSKWYITFANFLVLPHMIPPITQWI
jgi:hypothetical protein